MNTEIRQYLLTSLKLIGFRTADIVFLDGTRLTLDRTGKIKASGEETIFDSRMEDAMNFAKRAYRPIMDANNRPVDTLKVDGIYLVRKDDLEAFPFFRSIQDIADITGKSMSNLIDFINAYVPKFGSTALRYVDIRLYIWHRYAYLKERKMSMQAENLPGLMALTAGSDPYTPILPYLKLYHPFSTDPYHVTVDQLARILQCSHSRVRKTIHDIGVKPVMKSTRLSSVQKQLIGLHEKTIGADGPKLYDIREIRGLLDASEYSNHKLLGSLLNSYISNITQEKDK